MAAKGPDGRSSVYRDADGRWHGWVSFGTDGSTGKRRRRHVRGPTKAAASAKVAELERQRAAGAGLAPNRPQTVAEWSRTWLEAQASQVRRRTLEGYGPDVARLVAALGDRRVDEVTPADIEALYAATRRERSPATVAHLHRTVSACFVAAERAGVVGAAPTRKVRGPSAPPPEVVPLSATEARAVLEVARGQRNATRWSVALGLG